MHETEINNYLAVIKVVGVGGGGTNAVNRMIEEGIRGVEFVAINTDAQALAISDADIKVHIGTDLTRGLAPAPTPRLAARLPMSPATTLRGARWCRHGVHHLRRGRWHRYRRCSHRCRYRDERGRCADRRVVTKPFTFEGRKRKKSAEEGIKTLSDCVDTMIVIPNDKLLDIAEKKTTMLEAFAIADGVLSQAPRHHRPHHRPRYHQPGLRRC